MGVSAVKARHSGKDGRSAGDLRRGNDFLCAPEQFCACTHFPEYAMRHASLQKIECVHIQNLESYPSKVLETGGLRVRTQ